MSLDPALPQPAVPGWPWARLWGEAVAIEGVLLPLTKQLCNLKGRSSLSRSKLVCLCMREEAREQGTHTHTEMKG